MKGLMIVSTLVVCALARPDIGLNLRNAYQYQPPSTSYGTPHIPTGSYLPGSGNQGSSSNQFQTGTSLNIADFARQGTGFHRETTSSFNQGSTGGTGFQSTGLQSGFQSTGGGFGGFQQQQTQVQKHIYFYDSPEDLPAPTIRITGGGSGAQKNYKIIFIKAPAYQAPQVPQIPIQQQNEEKTVVYVLVKKPDDAQDIVIPTLAPSKVSKPEVFFIKYKTQKEAEAHVQNIQNGAQGGNAANSVDSSATFVSTITDTKVNTGGGGGGGQTSGFITTSNAGDLSTNPFATGGNTITTSVGTGPNYGPAIPNGSGPY